MSVHSPLKRLETASAGAIALERLPTNTTSRHHSVHRWFNFIAGFSPEFVQTCLAMTGCPNAPATMLLDPFSGCGAAPVAARLAGISAVAFEAHPFFALISEAKANSPAYWDDLPRIHAALAQGLLKGDCRGEVLSPSASAFLGKMFTPEVLKSLRSARIELREAGLGTHPLAVLVLSRILDHCCLAATDGIYKAPTSTKRALTPKAALDKVLETLQADHVEASAGAGLVRVHATSSEVMDAVDDNSIDLVVTSPPYLNNFDYAEMTRIYLYFWGLASSWSEITDRVRSRLIVNTTTALKGHKDRQEAYRETIPAGMLRDIDARISCLTARRRERAGKKEYDLLVYPYLSQMLKVLNETHRVLKPGAPMHMMVSDAALYGVHLPAPQWLAELMESCGFEDVRCEQVRVRGGRWILDKRENPAEGLGEYYVFGRAS